MKPLINRFRTLSDRVIAFFIILLITIIYLFPAFLGKVDTPVDIRDSTMYPWSYWAVDQKIKTYTLSENNKLKVVRINPNSAVQETFKINSSKSLIRKISKIQATEITCYLTFDFKALVNNTSNLNFEVYLSDPSSNLDFKLPTEVIKDAAWHKAYCSLKEILKHSLTLAELNSCNIKIKITNHSISIGSFHIKNFKLLCDDYSKRLKAHNPYVEDLIQWFTPSRELFSESLKKGKIPFWNNYIFSGIEFVNGDPQIGYFHPLCFLSYLILDHFTAHEVITFICLALSGIGAYLLTRFWSFSIAAALFTSIVYMFHPYNVYWFSFEHMLMNSATLPFLLLAYEKNLKETKFLNKYLIICTFLLGLIFLSGHLQVAYYTTILFFLFTVFHFLREKQYSNFLIRLLSILFIFTFALLISSIVLVPFIPSLQDSHRTALAESTMQQVALSLKSFLTLINPKAIDVLTTNYFYVGILPLLFSMVALSFQFQKGLTIFLVVLITMSLTLSANSPLFFLVKDFVPGFNQLQHHRLVEIYSYCIPFLSGIGFQILINRFSFFRKKLQLLFVIIVMMISAADLIYQSSSNYITWSDRKDYKSIPQGGSLEYLTNAQKKQNGLFRVLPFVVKEVNDVSLRTSAAVPNSLMPYRIEDISGYSSFIPKDIYNLFIYIQTKVSEELYTKRMSTYFDKFNIPYPLSNYKSKIFDLLNVKYFLVPNFLVLEDKNVKKVFSGDCVIYENLDYLPRAFVVPNYRVIKDPKETIVTLDSDGFDARKEVVLRERNGVSAYRRIGERELSYDIDFVKYENNNITLKVKINNAGFLVLGHNLTNNWKVKVNGKEGKHFKANLVQRAVYLAKGGEYIIEFYYFPKLFYIGLSITCFALIILGFLAFCLRTKHE